MPPANGRTTPFISSAKRMAVSCPMGMFVRTDRSTIINTDKLYKLNLLDRSCTLRSGDGRELELKLSKSAAETLMSLPR